MHDVSMLWALGARANHLVAGSSAKRSGDPFQNARTLGRFKTSKTTSFCPFIKAKILLFFLFFSVFLSLYPLVLPLTVRPQSSTRVWVFQNPMKISVGHRRPPPTKTLSKVAGILKLPKNLPKSPDRVSQVPLNTNPTLAPPKSEPSSLDLASKSLDPKAQNKTPSCLSSYLWPWCRCHCKVGHPFVFRRWALQSSRFVSGMVSGLGLLFLCLWCRRCVRFCV